MSHMENQNPSKTRIIQIIEAIIRLSRPNEYKKISDIKLKFIVTLGIFNKVFFKDSFIIQNQTYILLQLFHLKQSHIGHESSNILFN